MELLAIPRADPGLVIIRIFRGVIPDAADLVRIADFVDAAAGGAAHLYRITGFADRLGGMVKQRRFGTTGQSPEGESGQDKDAGVIRQSGPEFPPSPPENARY